MKKFLLLMTPAVFVGGAFGFSWLWQMLCAFNNTRVYEPNGLTFCSLVVAFLLTGVWGISFSDC
jgi:uncharacterized membrane protein SpoIIM required for sporulation